MSNKALLNGFTVGKRKTGKMSKILSFGNNWIKSVLGGTSNGTGLKDMQDMQAMKWQINWPI
jgi:hypothetical protein